MRHSNFARAAAELGVTPTAVSLRIRDLEADLGTRLFERFGPRVSPTDAGTALAERLGEALQLIRCAVDECRGLQSVLRITAPPTFATRWLAPRLSAYHLLEGSASIELDVSDEVRARDEFDIAIRTGRGDWPGLDAVQLMPVEATPMLSPKLAATIDLHAPSDLAALLLLPHDEWRRWFREFGKPGLSLRYLADNFPTHDLDATAAIEGSGVALLSPLLFAALLDEKKLMQPFPHVLSGPNHHWLLLRPGEQRLPALRFKEWVQSLAAPSELASAPA